MTVMRTVGASRGYIALDGFLAEPLWQHFGPGGPI